MFRSVSAGRLGEGGESQVEIREPGSWSVHREPDGRQQRLPKHVAKGQEKVTYLVIIDLLCVPLLLR